MESLVNLFTNEHGNFQTNFKINTLLVFLSLLVIFSKIWGSNIQGIFIILLITICLYFTNIYVNMSDNVLNDNNKQIQIKLQTLQSKILEYIKKKIILKTNSGIKLSKNDQINIFNKNILDSLYTDSTLIYFLYSILPLYEYNNDEFYIVVKGTNNILKLLKEIEDYNNSNKNIKNNYIQRLPSFRTDPIPKIEPIYLENLAEMFQIAIQIKTTCVNSLQNIIYSVPKTTKMYDYIDNITERYIILINRKLEKFQKYNNDSIKYNGITNKTKFINYKQTKGFDSFENHSVIPSKQFDDLIQLYI